jgi:polar amino acid transport system permease protein
MAERLMIARNKMAVRAGAASHHRSGRPTGSIALNTVLPTVIALVVLAWLVTTINWSFVQTLDFSALYKYRFALLEGLVNTLIVTACSLILGLFLGFIFAVCLYIPFRPFRWLILTYLEILRDTPLVVTLFWFHFALPMLTGISTTALESGFIVMSLQSSAYLADIVRAGIQAIPKGQWDAADALGLSRTSKWVDVVLPQAFKIIVPPLANIGIGYFKASSVLALLPASEFMSVALRVGTYSFKPIETLTIVGIVYLTLGYILSVLTYRLEKVLKRSGT